MQFHESEAQVVALPWQGEEEERGRIRLVRREPEKLDKMSTRTLKQRFWHANLVIIAIGIGLVVLSMLPFLKNHPIWRDSLRTVGLSAGLFVGINATLAAFRIYNLTDRSTPPYAVFDCSGEKSRERHMARDAERAYFSRMQHE